MADQVITLTIPSGKVDTALEGFLAIYPNTETIDDPEWVESEEVPEQPQIPKYTDKKWVTERVRRLVIRDIRRGLQLKANKEARIEQDNTLIT